MDKIWWLGLPVKTWVIVIIPTFMTGIAPFIAAQIINKKDSKGDLK